jgi:helicase
MKKVEKIIMQLESFNFITTKKKKFISEEFIPAFELDDTLSATRLGKRVSELYLDPVSAHKIITDINKKDDLDILVTVNQCLEMWPLMRVKQREYEMMEETLNESGIDFPEVWAVDYEEFLDAFKQSLFLNDWMKELGEDKLLDKYSIPPGEVHGKIKNAEWLLYSARELALLLNKKENANNFNKLKLRIKHGVKEELLTLVKLKSIGRVRARILYKNNIKKPSDIKKAGKEKVEKILGKKIAQQLLEQLEESLESKMRRIKRHYKEME